jgi:integrase
VSVDLDIDAGLLEHLAAEAGFDGFVQFEDAAGGFPASTALVFTNPKGAALRRGNFRRMVDWPKIVAEVGVPDFHDLRHTGNHLASRVPGTTIRHRMTRMGHDSTRAAMIYMHGSSAADRAIADSMPVEIAGDDHDEDPRDNGAAGALVPAGS